MLYTPKHLSLELGVTQKRIAELARQGFIQKHTAGKLVRYEAGEGHLIYIRALIKAERDAAEALGMEDRG